VSLRTENLMHLDAVSLVHCHVYDNVSVLNRRRNHCIGEGVSKFCYSEEQNAMLFRLDGRFESFERRIM
jgi:hypothetical protein